MKKNNQELFLSKKWNKLNKSFISYLFMNYLCNTYIYLCLSFI